MWTSSPVETEDLRHDQLQLVTLSLKLATCDRTGRISGSGEARPVLLEGSRMAGLCSELGWTHTGHGPAQEPDPNALRDTFSYPTPAPPTREAAL